MPGGRCSSRSIMSSPMEQGTFQARDVRRGARVIGKHGSVYTLQGARPVHAERQRRHDAASDVIATVFAGTSPALLAAEDSIMTTFLRHCLRASAIAGLLATATLVGADDGRMAQTGG